MGKKLADVLALFRAASFTRRLILSMILVVAVTVMLGGLPAIVMIWGQLENQIWLRVQNAQGSTQALYVAEQNRLAGAVQLVAERPTLCNLLAQPDIPALKSYLEILRQNTDALYVITSSGQSVGGGQDSVPDPDVLLANRELPFTDFFTQSDPPQVLIVSAMNVQPAVGCDTPAVGKVVMARVLDNEFMQTLSAHTGLEQNLIVGNVRVATSMFQIPDWPLDLEATARVVASGAACCTRGASQEEEYYLGLAPLVDDLGQVVAISEVALPGGAIRANMERTVALLLAVGFLAALGGSLLAILATARIARPLAHLTKSAEQMSAGDLDTPIVAPESPVELRKLAEQLDRARRHVRETLRVTQSEMKHIERLFGKIREGVVALDESGRVTFFNPDAEKILGFRSVEVMQQHFTRIFRPAPGEAITMYEVLQPANGALPARHITILDAQERPVTLAVSASSLAAEPNSDRLRERVVVLRDIGEEEMVNRLRANFMANIAHEFRTPISGIAASIELLREEGPSLTHQELIELTNTIHLSTLRLQTLLDNLLESATLEAGCFRIRRRPIQFQDVLEVALSTMMPLFKRRSQPLEVEIPPDLPTFWADPDRLAQVLVNLLSNASKFSPMGVPVSLVVEQQGDILQVAVLDAGPGLSEAQFANLFKRFAVGEQPQDAQYGIGLGLAVVKAIIEAHAGQIGAENRSEGGVRIWFTLPLKPLVEE